MSEFNFEFYPPKTEKGKSKLRQMREELAKLNPSYISVTFGAGGSTQEDTFDTTKAIKNSSIEAARHISGIGQIKEQIKNTLQSYASIKINRHVVLRRDIRSEMGLSTDSGFQYASEFVEIMRNEISDYFLIEVAASPEFSPQGESAQTDLVNFKCILEASADGAITQYFFDPNAYFRFIDDCEKMDINIPIVPGITPIANYKQLT